MSVGVQITTASMAGSARMASIPRFHRAPVSPASDRGRRRAGVGHRDQPRARMGATLPP
jgi:hypothetical protein